MGTEVSITITALDPVPFYGVPPMKAATVALVDNVCLDRINYHEDGSVEAFAWLSSSGEETAHDLHRDYRAEGGTGGLRIDIRYRTDNGVERFTFSADGQNLEIERLQHD